MDSTKRYKSGEAPLRPDQRLSRETRAERAERERRHERLVNGHMYHAANSCAKKRRYVTYDQARDTARFCEESEGRPLYIYKCEFCGGWHLTHQADQQRYGRETGREAQERITREEAAKTAMASPAARFDVGDLVIDETTDTPCVVNAVGEIGGEPAASFPAQTDALSWDGFASPRCARRKHGGATEQQATRRGRGPRRGRGQTRPARQARNRSTGLRSRSRCPQASRHRGQ